MGAAVALSTALVLTPASAGATNSKRARVLVAYDARTGAVKWRLHRGSGLLDVLFEHHGLVVANERKCLSQDRKYRRGDEALVALDARTGRERWRVDDVKVPSGIDNLGAGDPGQFAGDTIAAASQDRLPPPRARTLGVAATTGEVGWRSARGTALQSANARSVVIASGDVFFAAGSEFTAVGRSDGRRRWTYTLPDGRLGAALQGNTVVAVVTTFTVGIGNPDVQPQSVVEILDDTDGRLLRTIDLDFLPIVPAHVSGSTILLGRDGGVVAFDLTNGQRLWSGDGVLTGESSDTGIALLLRGVGVAGSSGEDRVDAVDVSTGATRWTALPGFHAQVDASTVALESTDRLLTALDASTGTQRWQVPMPSRGDQLALGPSAVYVSGGCAVSSAR